MKQKEIYWLFGTIILILILTLIIFWIDGFKSDATLSINIYNTYYVISNYQIIPLLFIGIFFVVYLLRAIKQRFKNNIVNIILIVVTILCILIFIKLADILDFL